MFFGSGISVIIIGLVWPDCPAQNILFWVVDRAVDPHSFFADTDSGFSELIRIQLNEKSGSGSSLTKFVKN